MFSSWASPATVSMLKLADVIFPVRATTDELYVIDTTGSHPGSTLVVASTKDTILSLAVLLEANFKVEFAVVKTEIRIFAAFQHVSWGEG